LRIYIAGQTGLVGSALTRAVDSKPDLSWIGKTHRELDLTDRKAVFDYVNIEKPDAMIIAAAKVGGIMANATYPVEFLSQNIQISTNLMDAAHAANIERLVFLGSSCVYPKLSLQPIKEEYLLTGPLEETNEAYAIAKIAGIKLVDAYRRQHRRNWFSVMPTNLYGPGDNFDPESSHVIPGLIAKFHEAKIRGLNELTLWGSGSPKREFMHSSDLAEGVLYLLNSEYVGPIVNIGTGDEVTIKELAASVSKIIGYAGLVRWDSSYPDGAPRKLLDSSIIQDLGWRPTVTLDEGIAREYRQFQQDL
jgi:GDP-L-fucose synthase